MSFLLDTDICSAYFKNEQKVIRKVMFHFGSLSVSSITVAELMTWVHRKKAPPTRLQDLKEFLAFVTIHNVDKSVAEQFGKLRAEFLDQGRAVPEMDLLIGSTALVHNHTLVTHNLVDYQHIPGLVIDDWRAS